MNIIKNKFFFIGFSALLVIASLVIIMVRGLNFSIEFTEGSLAGVRYEQVVAPQDIQARLAPFDFRAQVQPFGETGMIIRMRELSEAERGVLLAALEIEGNPYELERFTTVGPSVGRELRSKAVLSLILVSLAIILFVAFVFRHVSRPVSSWKYGLVAVVALLHDIIIPLGIFALLGKDISTLVVVGMLSILGLSVNDTIVVFDRIRENLGALKENERFAVFDETVNKALRQSFARSFNTSFTLVIVLVALLVVGPFATRDLALILLVGTLVGTYSSLFLASPLLTLWKGKESE
ncbi:MAG: protein translocase subunit SecF [Candidatus Pacebacteria bacterium]|nr:protein translocase subunit SecF [Candidatus Paceibacterota bacterium]MCD8508329.1 protein translocase subunit SecF [Candidatus Paceibacterota bacterium]MCD8527880.1 protein translocase subunit SecF [Candidatus Paceibacterota bacterium]MCD8564006.1 protein translocase subunit SecF [Candidatus Paceibacterota bacterium]